MMTTLEDQIEKTKERLLALEQQLEEEELQRSEREVRGPSARMLNQLARDVRVLLRALEICERRFGDEAQSMEAVGALVIYKRRLLHEWMTGYVQKLDYCDRINDRTEIERLYAPEKFVDEFGLEIRS